MRDFWVLVAAILSICPAVAQDLPVSFNQPREINNIRSVGDLRTIWVVSWNVDRGTRFDELKTELERDPADLCLLQEVDWNAKRSGDRDVGEDLARALGLNLAYGIEFEELGQEGGRQAYIGQATLTRLPIRRVRVLRFKQQSGFWKPRRWMPSSIPLLQRRRGDRIALVTELEFAGRPLVVYNTHLESRSMGRIQNLQLDEILGDIKKRYPPGTAVILGGDLNTKYFPGNYLRKLQTAGFRSVMGGRMERTHAIAMTLDWIFVRGGIEVEDGRVRRDFRGSDHYPVYAKLATH